MEVVERVVMRGGWGWTLCNGFNPRDTTWSSSSESTWYSRLAPLMVPPATPLICASGLGNGDSAVAVACPPPRHHGPAPKINNLTLGAAL